MATISKKVCLLGDFAVGKTSLVRRFVYDRFDDKYLSTIGVKVSSKTVAIAHDGRAVELAMMLWDLAGSEEFERMRSSYLRGAAAAILVCDVTRVTTLQQLAVYANDLLKINPHARIIVAANKADLSSQYMMTADDVRTFAQQLQAPYYLTSAKQGDEVESMFRHLGRMLVD